MAALTTPTLQELKDFYPVSASLPDEKREELAKYVGNHIFLKMFGFETAAKIVDGTIASGASAAFIGFQKFFALCCAYQEVKDPLVSTNFGAKIVTRPGVENPTNQQKSITLIELENSISIHLEQAYKYLGDSNCEEQKKWSGYFSYKVSRL